MFTRRSRTDLLGRSFTWLCGGALALNLLLAIGLLLLIAIYGLGYFWQKPLLLLALKDGTQVLGEVHEREPIPGSADDPTPGDRLRLKVGNRDLYGLDFRWVDERDIATRSYPADAALLERYEWGNFYGDMVELRRGDELLASGQAPVWAAFGPLHEAKLRERAAITALERGPMGDVNYALEQLRLAERRLALGDLSTEARARQQAAIDARRQALQAEYDRLAAQLLAMREHLRAETLVMDSADGKRKTIPVGEIVSAIRPNSLGTFATARLYAQRLWQFIADDPRESNTEGGIFPAIFGTVMMVFLMSFAVAPFGVLAALYLREYSREGVLVRATRIAVNNLAGVPSIVFGVFGLGFFVYLIGGTLDHVFYPEALPTPTFGTGGILWASLTLALLTVPVVIVATEEGLAAVPRVVREGSLALGGDQVRDHVARRGAGRRARHSHRHDSGHGARRRRGGAADDRRHGQARSGAADRRPAFRSCTWSASSCISGSISTTSASRARTSKRRSRWCSRRRCCWCWWSRSDEPRGHRRPQSFAHALRGKCGMTSADRVPGLRLPPRGALAPAANGRRALGRGAPHAPPNRAGKKV
jgi:phosphate transport system permease protein